MRAEHPSAFVLDSLDLGLLDEEAARAARAHSGQCAGCTARLAEQREARARFDAHVFSRTLPAVERRGRSAGFRLRILLLLPSLAALAIVAVAFRPEAGGDFTAKGTPILSVYAQRDGRVFPVPDGTALMPGDEIRFVVQPAGLRHVLVASVDAAGAATIYAPFGASRSLQLDSTTARFEMPGSVRLDSAAGPETLVALFSRRPLESAAVLEQLRRKLVRGPEALRRPANVCVSGASCASISIEKVVP